MLTKLARSGSVRGIGIRALAFVIAACATFTCGAPASAAINSAGSIGPQPPAAGGNVTGPFRIGIDDVGRMDIAGGTALTSTAAATLGDTVTGLGIVTMTGFFSDWTLTTAGADLTVGNLGTGSISLANLALLEVNDDLFVAAQLNSLGEISISGLGTIVDVGDDATIAQRGQANIVISDGGRLLSDVNIVGDEAGSDGRVTVTDQFSLWRTTSTLTLADAGRGLMQVLDGGRVENTVGIIGNLLGSNGTAEVVGLGSLWQNSAGLTIGEFGNGTLLVTDGGRVTNGGGVNLMILGRQNNSSGQVVVRGIDSTLAVAAIRVGDTGDGSLRVLDSARVTSGQATLGDNTTARGVALVEGAGAIWEVSGELIIADPGESHLTIADGGVVRSSNVTRVNALGRITLDGGRLEAGGTTALLNTGIVEGSGTIESLISNNNAGGQIRAHGAGALVFTGTLNNAGLVDVQSGELEIIGHTSNSSDIDARDGAILRFGGSGLDNNASAQLAVTSGIVDVFGTVDNNANAEIVVGGSATAVFHDAVTNNGAVLVQPGGELLTLENLGFAAGAALTIGLQDVDLSEPSDGFGQVQVTGAATLAGTLEVELLGGFMPLAGDFFQILSAGGGLSGMFGTEVLPALSGGLDWEVQYNPNSVVLAVVGPSLLGDYNQNGVVDAADYVVWRNTLGQMGAGLVADGNNNGEVDTGDYSVWRANFGKTAAGAGTSNANAVPEPASISLLLIACAVLGRRRG
jgi:T5SS/PEP-CTERM-associated repeat protein